MIDIVTKNLLIKYANVYETEDFLIGDPSWFMHQVQGEKNQEAMAFIASCLSYGSRPQIMKIIQKIYEWTNGDVDDWVRSGGFKNSFKDGEKTCFYRLYNYGTMCRFLCVYQQLLLEFGSLGEYVRLNATDGFSAINTISYYFGNKGISVVVPKDTHSACKRVCLFLRWMVRSDSPVDLGLWQDFIDRRSLIIPLDTHVLRQSLRLGLINSKTATMSCAKKLTAKLAEIFPDDPVKGDYALFGYGVKSL